MARASRPEQPIRRPRPQFGTPQVWALFHSLWRRFGVDFLARARRVHLGPEIGTFMSGMGPRATPEGRLWNGRCRPGRNGRPGAPDRHLRHPKYEPYSAQCRVVLALILSPGPNGSVWALESGPLLSTRSALAFFSARNCRAFGACVSRHSSCFPERRVGINKLWFRLQGREWVGG